MSHSIDTSRPMTVLFHIQDEAEFRDTADKLFDSLKNGTVCAGAVVTGISTEDEFARIERMEEAGHGE